MAESPLQYRKQQEAAFNTGNGRKPPIIQEKAGSLLQYRKLQEAPYNTGNGRKPPSVLEMAGILLQYWKWQEASYTKLSQEGTPPPSILHLRNVISWKIILIDRFYKFKLSVAQPARSKNVESFLIGKRLISPLFVFSSQLSKFYY